MKITKTIEIDMGHCLKNHNGKCHNIHGHRYKIEAGVDDKVLKLKNDSSDGMVIDFSELKQSMMNIIDKEFDHGFVIQLSDKREEFFENLAIEENQKVQIVPFAPTAENLAKLWYQLLKRDLMKKNINIHHVTVWETPTSTATYTIIDEVKDNESS